MKRRFASRHVRSLIPAVLLGAGALAFDSGATPELIGDDPWWPSAARSGDLPPDSVRHRKKGQTVVDLGVSSPLELGEISFETGALTLTRVDVYNNYIANFLHLADTMNSSAADPRVAAEDEDKPSDATFQEAAWRESASDGSGTGGSRPDPGQIWELRQLREGTGEILTHPLTILAVLIFVGAWLLAKLMDRVDRLRTTKSRMPGRSRYRGRRHRSRRDRSTRS